MDKIARSSDPQQQILRDRKKQFNLASREFIKRLIALKKGINGRGDNSFGIPVSKIGDPLPPEVLSMLQEVSSNFEQLAAEALQISQEQAYYSEHRRKPQPKATETKPAVSPMEPAPSPLAGLEASAPHLLTRMASVLTSKWSS